VPRRSAFGVRGSGAGFYRFGVQVTLVMFGGYAGSRRRQKAPAATRLDRKHTKNTGGKPADMEIVVIK
jgi:hypothetical protein